VIVSIEADVGIWKPMMAKCPITNERSENLIRGEIDSESQLAEWIENDLDLLDHGLAIANRHTYMEAGNPNLVALNLMRQWEGIGLQHGPI
jgi:hypothetical protein